MANYAVIFNYSFDDEVAVYLFSDENDAKKFLKANYEKELKIDTEENGWNSFGSILEDGWYAKITNVFYDCEDVTEFRIGVVHLQ